MSELKTSFLGALQASLSVLLVISYGVVAAQFDLLKGSSTKQISTLCVRMFLPALLITNVGSQLHADTGIRYVPILSECCKEHRPCKADLPIVWALFYTLASMGLGLLATRLFKLPSWITPALCFNNTTSLPLLLIESLETTGILEKLLMSDRDSSSAALLRAKSYFLVNSIVGNSLTFALGPRLLDGEESPEEVEEDQKQADGRFVQPQQDSEQGNYQSSERPEEQRNGHGNPDYRQAEDTEEAHEETSLLPQPVVRRVQQAERSAYGISKEQWDKLRPWTKYLLEFSYSFLNAPLVGAVIGAILGLAPPLHKAFFNSPLEGGIFTAWLTDSVSRIGGLFATLQVVVVGVKLSSSLRKMKRGEESGQVPWVPTTFVLFVRFLLWPA